jgi:hypothetical protein
MHNILIQGKQHPVNQKFQKKELLFFKALFCFICVYLRPSAAELGRGWKNGHFRRISGWIA